MSSIPAAHGPSVSGWNLSMGATAFVTGASAVIMGTLPLLMGLFSQRLELDWQQIGWLGTAGQAGTLTGTLFAYWLIGRGLLRPGVRFGTLCALVFWTLAAFADDYFMLLAWRALTAAGVGCLFAIGTYLLARAASPARAFSIMSGVQVACGALHSAVLPWIDGHFGHVFAILSINVWFAAILILLMIPWRSSPSLIFDGHAPSAAHAERSGGSSIAVRLIASILAFQTATVVMWIYCERIAASAGLPPAAVGVAIAMGNLGGIPASILGMLAGDRFGYLPVLALATVAVAGGELLIVTADAVAIYGAGQLLFNFGWMLGLSYYLGLLAQTDTRGRMIRLAPPALVIAGAIGPTAIALFTSGDEPAPVLGLSLTCCLGALALAIHKRSK